MVKQRILTSLTSPYGRILRILVAEHGLDVEIEVVNPWQDRSPLEGISPISKIPVLIIEDGTPIVDSWVIAEHLDAQSGSPLLPNDRTKRVKVLSACAVCHDVLNSGTLVVGSKLKGYPLSDNLVEWHFGKAQGGLADIEKRLGDGEFGVQGQFGMLDVTAAATVGFFEFRLKDDFRLRDRLPDLATWYDNVTGARPSISETAPPQT